LVKICGEISQKKGNGVTHLRYILRQRLRPPVEATVSGAGRGWDEEKGRRGEGEKGRRGECVSS